MTELPEDVARELNDLFGVDDVPNNAVTMQQLSDMRGHTPSTWRKRIRQLVIEGKWKRGKRVGSQAYWYWPVKDEGN